MKEENIGKEAIPGNDKTTQGNPNFHSYEKKEEPTVYYENELETAEYTIEISLKKEFD